MLQQSAGLYPCLRLTASLVLQVSVLNLSSTTFGNPVNIIMSMPSFVKDILSETSTVVPGFSVLGFRALPGFRALNTGNQIWVYVIDLPGFCALPGFRAPF